VAFADESLHNLFVNQGFASGITLTANGFYAPQGRAIRLQPAHPNFLNVLTSFSFDGQQVTNMEMETAGIYGLATALGHKAISLNALLANRMEGTFVKDPEALIKQMIEKALGII
jgi:uridine phosphorylase